jgi:o-succinylbenzoate---CoA ligase
MEQNAQRELRTVSPEWTVSELMARIAKALVSDGPALAFSPTSHTHVPSRVSLVLSTTGSSGLVKEVGLSASALLTSARAANNFLAASFGNSWSLLLPLNHIAGVNVLIRSLELGTEPIDLRNRDGELPKADFTAIVPTQLFKALNGDDHLLAHLISAKAVLIGGAPISTDLMAQAKMAGINLVTSYGMTETAGGFIYNGVPLAESEIKLTSQNCLAIKGSVLASTYIGAEPLWEAQFEDGWFITKDLAKFEGEKLIVIGRSDDVIISGGENISLDAVEGALAARFTGKTFGALAKNDARWGDALHVAIVGEDLPAESEINDFLIEKFGAGAKPKGFFYPSQLPLLGIGKVDRNKLMQLIAEVPS